MESVHTPFSLPTSCARLEDVARNTGIMLVQDLYEVGMLQGFLQDDTGVQQGAMVQWPVQLPARVHTCLQDVSLLIEPQQPIHDYYCGSNMVLLFLQHLTEGPRGRNKSVRATSSSPVMGGTGTGRAAAQSMGPPPCPQCGT